MGLSNNDILKKLRVAHAFRDDDIIKIMELVDFRIGKSELSAFFRKEGHPKIHGMWRSDFEKFFKRVSHTLARPDARKKNKLNYYEFEIG